MRAGRPTPAILSGPSFAADVARGLPTAVTLAARDEASRGRSRRRSASRDVPALSIDRRARRRDRRRGQERAGDRRRHRDRPRARRQRPAALITRGFAELVRFGRALGAKPETMMGLSGLGDLMLTCSSPQSRNFSFGIALGKGLAPKDVHGTTGLAEGAFTAPVLLEMAREQKCRHADFDGGRRHAVRTAERGPGDRVAVDATVADGGLMSAVIPAERANGSGPLGPAR